MPPVYCTVCGRPVPPPPATQTRGRRKERHHECVKLATLLSQVHDKIPLIHFARDERGSRARRFVRSQLTNLGNQWLQPFNAKRDDTDREFLERPS